MAIECVMGNTRFVLFNVYMPYQTPDNEDEYHEKLGCLKSFIDEINCTNYAVIGDWNANLGVSGTMTFKAPMIDFCNDNELLISSNMLLTNSTYTHISSYEGNFHYSWLDHIVSSQDFHQSINDISVIYEMSDNDHIPVSFNVCVDNLPASSDAVNDISAKIKWDAVTDANRNLYYSNSDRNLGKIIIPVSAICCSNTACEEESHKQQLNKFYSDIVSGMQVSSKHIVKNDSKHLNKPGWSDYVADLYKFSRESYKLRLDNGKPR